MTLTRSEYDCSTGEQADVELSPEEEAALLAMREQIADQEENPPPTKSEILQDLLDSIDPSDLNTDALQIMLLVQQEMLRP